MSKLSTWPQPSLLLQIERICQINQDYIITIIGIICDKLSYLRLSAARKRLYITDKTYITPRATRASAIIITVSHVQYYKSQKKVN